MSGQHSAAATPGTGKVLLVDALHARRVLVADGIRYAGGDLVTLEDAGGGRRQARISRVRSAVCSTSGVLFAGSETLSDAAVKAMADDMGLSPEALLALAKPQAGGDRDPCVLDLDDAPVSESREGFARLAQPVSASPAQLQAPWLTQRRVAGLIGVLVVCLAVAVPVLSAGERGAAGEIASLLHLGRAPAPESMRELERERAELQRIAGVLEAERTAARESAAAAQKLLQELTVRERALADEYLGKAKAAQAKAVQEEKAAFAAHRKELNQLKAAHEAELQALKQASEKALAAIRKETLAHSAEAAKRLEQASELQAQALRERTRALAQLDEIKREMEAQKGKFAQERAALERDRDLVASSLAQAEQLHKKSQGIIDAAIQDAATQRVAAADARSTKTQEMLDLATRTRADMEALRAEARGLAERNKALLALLEGSQVKIQDAHAQGEKLIKRGHEAALGVEVVSRELRQQSADAMEKLEALYQTQALETRESLRGDLRTAGTDMQAQLEDLLKVHKQEVAALIQKGEQTQSLVLRQGIQEAGAQWLGADRTPVPQLLDGLRASLTGDLSGRIDAKVSALEARSSAHLQEVLTLSLKDTAEVIAAAAERSQDQREKALADRFGEYVKAAQASFGDQFGLRIGESLDAQRVALLSDLQASVESGVQRMESGLAVQQGAVVAAVQTALTDTSTRIKDLNTALEAGTSGSSETVAKQLLASVTSLIDRLRQDVAATQAEVRANARRQDEAQATADSRLAQIIKSQADIAVAVNATTSSLLETKATGQEARARSMPPPAIEKKLQEVEAAAKAGREQIAALRQTQRQQEQEIRTLSQRVEAKPPATVPFLAATTTTGRVARKSDQIDAEQLIQPTATGEAFVAAAKSVRLAEPSAEVECAKLSTKKEAGWADALRKAHPNLGLHSVDTEGEFIWTTRPNGSLDPMRMRDVARAAGC
jgi:hypothetical protein